MTQSGVSAFARLARRFALSAVLLLAGAGALAAQTGKLEGKVRDQAGAPIQSAQVFIVGTAFSALTNAQGYYFINNVPAGTITIRGVFIGYKKTEVEGVKMLAGQTITQDIQLEKQAVVLDSLVVTTATNPLVPRDEVTTKGRVDGQFTENLPVDRVTQVLQLQPGVVAEGANGQFLSVRGGRSDEAAAYIDGVSVQPGNRGNGFVAAGTTASNGQNSSGSSANNAGATSASGVTFGTNGFEEASVTTGAASAQYGNAQSGIVSLTTRTGGSKFAGRLAVESDEIFGSTIGMGFNRFEGNLSGPLGLKGLTFSLNLAGEGNVSARSGKGREDYPIFVTSGVDTVVSNPNSDGSFSDVNVNSYSIYTGDCGTFANSSNAAIASNNGDGCHGARLPYSGFSGAQVAGNINFSYGNGSRLRLGGAGSQLQGRNFNYFFTLNPGSAGNLQNGQRAQNAIYTLNWTQNLSKSAERALALDVNLSYQTDRFIFSPFADGGPGDGWRGFYFSPIPLQYGFDFLDTRYDVAGNPAADGELTKLDCFIRNLKTCLGAIDLNNADSVNAHTAQVTYRSNPYGLAQTFPDGGEATTFLQLYSENRWVGNATFDWQLDRYNRVQFGGEYIKYDMTSYAASIASQAFSDYWAEKPVRWAAFVQDRLDIGDVVVQLGVRYDYFKTNASRWSGFPRISTNPALTPGEDPTNLYVADESFDYISPRVQVAFPVTERTNFRLSYAQAVQSPDFALTLSGINTDISVTNTNNVYGQNVDYGKSIIFEFGIQHAFSDDMVLDISAYNRDNLANSAGRLVSSFDPLTTQNQDLRLITNADFGNTKGIDLRLNRRFGQLFNGTLGYSYTNAANTGTDPFTYINFGSRVVNQVTGGNQPPPQAIAPVALSRPNQLTGSLALTFPNKWNAGSTIGSILQNFSIYALFRFATGTAYTACGDPDGNQAIRAGQVCNRGGFVTGLNSERLPSFKQFDMRFVKGFNLGGSQLAVYLDARNILGFTNTLTQYVTTSSITSEIEREQNFSADSTRNAQEGLGNGVYDPGTGAMNLTFGGAGASGCTDWVNSSNDPSVPNCVYLIRAEQRYGNGDGIYTVEEQLNASNALYYGNLAAPTYFYGAGTALRLGVEFTF